MRRLSDDELYVTYEYFDLKSILNFGLVCHDTSKWLNDGNSCIWSPNSHRFAFFTQLNEQEHKWKIDQYLKKFGTYKAIIQQFMLYRFCEDEDKVENSNGETNRTLKTLVNLRRTIMVDLGTWQTFKINAPLKQGQVYSWDFVLDEYSNSLNTYNVLLGLSTFYKDKGSGQLKYELIGTERRIDVSLNVGQMQLHYGSHRRTSFKDEWDLRAKTGDVFTFKLDTNNNISIYLNGSLLTSLLVPLSSGYTFYPGISTIHNQKITLRPSHMYME